jgi:hypothetical protein
MTSRWLTRLALTLTLATLVHDEVRAEEPAAPETAKSKRARRRTRGAAAAAPKADATATSTPASEVPAPSDAVAPPPASTIPHDALIRFEEDLGIGGGITLSGSRTNRTVDFALPSAWELTGDPVLNLMFHHSAALSPLQSRLAVRLNGQSIAGLTLDPTNQSEGVLSVKLPRKLLQAYNHLEFAVIQGPGTDCIDPFDPALWTRIAAETAIAVPHRIKRVTEALERWPDPMVDLRDYGKLIVTPVLSPTAGAATAKAVGAIGVTLGRLATYRGIDVRPAVAELSATATAAVVIGLADELPELATLIGAPVELKAGEGLVAQKAHPRDETLPVVIVAGADAVGLERAANALARQSAMPVLSGRVAYVRDATPASAPPRKETTRPFPDGETATFAELGVNDTTVRGEAATAVRVQANLEGDAIVRPGGGHLSLVYSYGAQLDVPLATMEVRVGGVSLRSVPLDNPKGEANVRLEVDVPAELLGVENTVDVVFHLIPKDFDACDWHTDRQLWGTVHGTSTLTLPRDHQARVPDLSRLMYRTWPFTADDEAHAVRIIVPDAPAAQTWSGAMLLAAALGRQSTAAVPPISMVLGKDARLDPSTAGHAVVFADGGPNAAYDALVAQGLMTWTDAPNDARLGSNDATVQSAGLAATSDAFEQVVYAPGHSALVLRSATEQGAIRLATTLADREQRERMHGAVAILDATGDARGVDFVAPQTTWGELPLSTRVQNEVREQWWTMGALVGAGGLLTIAAVRRMLRNRRSDA